MMVIEIFIRRLTRAISAYFLCPIARMLPATRFYRIKSFVYKLSGIRVGCNVRLVSSVRILTAGDVIIGNNTFIGHDCLIVGGDSPITIGDNCDVGPRVTFVSGTHHIQPDGPHVAGDGYSLPISVGEGSWICTGATILGGTTIGPRSIVAAGAVVKGVFPPGSLIGGIPARVLRDTLTKSNVNC